MHNLLSRAQFNEWRHLDNRVNELEPEEEKINDYYECIVECDSLNQNECKKFCRILLD
jgi:hypothetical protein